MKRLLFLVPFLFIVGCAQPAAEPAKPAVDPAKEEASIRATDDQWKAAIKSRDAAKTASFWSDDATLVMSGMPSVSGKAALQKFVDDAFKDKSFTIDWTTQKIEVAQSGELAYETAIETVTSTQGKKVITSHPFDTVIWKKQADGSWKAILDTSTEPAAPATAKAAKK